MKAFAQLIQELDSTTKINLRVAALSSYFDSASDSDKLWTIAILSHRRPKRSITTTQLREWAAELSALPLWLLEDTYHIVGDLAETIALLLPPTTATPQASSLTYWMELLIQLYQLPDEARKTAIITAWQQLDTTERFVFNKFITGGFRIGVSQKLMTRALARHTGLEENLLAHRLMGHWSPQDTTFHELVWQANNQEDHSRPYPFCLAYALETEPDALGAPANWQAEWKWDGIRGQVIIRNNQLFVWSRGEELLTDRFPELDILRTALPNGTVLDGEILVVKDGSIQPFQLLQTRITRKKVGAKLLKEAPVAVYLYDVLEWKGKDWREKPFRERRRQLEALQADLPDSLPLLLSPVVPFATWEEAAQLRGRAREQLSEGLMLKHLDSPYHTGRKKGDWWKWKVDPYTVDAVLIYAQQGHGRRANLFTDYTFAVWDGDTLVPFTKAYSGLTDAELREVDRFVKQHTVERFGPVRSVVPKLVFEIAFEGIAASLRHKSGIALRFPRIHRWRRDKPMEEANTLEDLKMLL